MRFLVEYGVFYSDLLYHFLNSGPPSYIGLLSHMLNSIPCLIFERSIGRVQKIAVEKEQAQYQPQVSTGRSQVPASAGTSESDHSGT